MGLFKKPSQPMDNDHFWKSDNKRFSKIENDPDVILMEKQVKYWMGTDEGWAEFNDIFVEAPVIVVKTQGEKSAAEMLPLLSDYIGTQDRFNLVMEGMLRAAAAGYAIAMSVPVARGYKPDSRSLDASALADTAAEIMLENAKPTDVEWFGYANRNGISVFQWMLLPLGESSDEVMSKGETSYLMLTGRWFIRYGMAVANAQLALEKSVQ
jgi:Acetyl xylan esterase (AXE1)